MMDQFEIQTDDVGITSLHIFFDREWWFVKFL